MEVSTNQEPDVKCLNKQELYALLFAKIKDRSEGGSGYSVMKDLGFSERLYYDIRDFAQGKNHIGRKSTALSEKHLKRLCEELGITFHNIMYVIEE